MLFMNSDFSKLGEADSVEKEVEAAALFFATLWKNKEKSPKMFQ